MLGSLKNLRLMIQKRACRGASNICGDNLDDFWMFIGFLRCYKIDKYKEAASDEIIQVMTSHAMRSMWSPNI